MPKRRKEKKKKKKKFADAGDKYTGSSETRSKYRCWSKKKVSPDARLVLFAASKSRCKKYLSQMQLMRRILPDVDVSCRFKRSLNSTKKHYKITREHMPRGYVIVQSAKKTQKRKQPRFIFLFWCQPGKEKFITVPKLHQSKRRPLRCVAMDKCR